MRTVVLDGDMAEILLDGDVSIDSVRDGEISEVIHVREILPTYTGETTVIPSDEQQT